MEKYIYFNSRDTFYRVELESIAYFKADRNYTLLYLTNGKELVFTFNLGTMLEYLVNTLKKDAGIFARIGKSVIINLNYVYQINLQNQTLQLYDSKSDTFFVLKDISKEALKALKVLYTKQE